MRNAVAHLDDEFAFDEPVRKAKPAKSRSPKKRAAARPKKSKRRYANVVAIGLSASLAVGIMVNALVMQHSRHPAPLFGQSIQLGALPAPAAAAPPVAASVPAEQTASAPAKGTQGADAAVPITPPPAARSHHVATAEAAAKPKPDDAIAKLLKATGGSSSSEKTKDNPKTVLATQHALMKLGFVVKPTGTFGAATRAALEAFERDQHLPVKGDMSHKLLKQLSAESGVAID